MSAITVTAAQVAVIDPLKSIIKSYIAYETITAGAAVYIDPTTGKCGLAEDASSFLQFRGIALNGGGAGQAIDVLEDGEVYGFTLAGNYDALVYASGSVAGGLDTAGSVVCGRIVPMANAERTKVLRVFVLRTAQI